jgi:hypothetical protein
MIEIPCTCGKVWYAEEFLAGRALACTSCGKVLLIPGDPPVTTSPPSKFPRRRDNSIRTLIGVVILACVAVVWLERYRFDHIDMANGESYPVRVNRLTGNAQVLYRGVWRPSSELPKLPPLIQDLGAQDLEKLKGNARLEADLPFLYLTVHNGSDFTLKEITVDVVIMESSGKEVLRRAYRTEQEHPSKQVKDYSLDLGFSLGPGQSWAWKIIAARGVKP